MPTLILSNPLGSDDAQRIGLDIREYAVGEIISVNDFAAVTLIRTGYALAIGDNIDVLITGGGTPNSSIGEDGQWYLDETNEVLWGPKTSGLWPSDPIRPDRGVAHFAIDGRGHLMMTYSTGTTVDLGAIIGPASNLTMGQVTTGAPGSQASATVTGTAPDQTLALTIPQGAKGDKGDQGIQGIQGIQGPAGTSPALPDATPTVKGVVQLAGDLAGTAAAPTVPGLAGKVNTSAVGAAGGVASLDSGGKVPTAQLPASVGSGGGSGGVQVGALAVAVDPNGVDIDVTITSNWGVTDAGAVYYNEQGAVDAEAAILVPDPDGTGWAVFRPGTAAWPTEDQRVAGLAGRAGSALRAALDARYTVSWGLGAFFPAVDPALLKPGDAYRHTAYGLHFWTGTAWRQRAQHELTAAQRAALDTSGLYSGYQVWETDTFTTATWNGTAWQFDSGQLPVAQIRQTASQSIGAGVWVPITFGSADYDPDGLFAVASTDRLTIKRKGIYRVSGVAMMTATATSMRVGSQLTKNGAALAGSENSLACTSIAGVGTGTPAIPLLMQLAAGDYIGLTGLAGAATTTIASGLVTSTLSVECVRLLP